MHSENMIIYSSGTPAIDDTHFEVVERKGIGHPDTLCDTLAEKISQAYSQYCLKKYGKILRHMVDKIALSGGSSKVMFGGGEMLLPIRLYLNCRFTRTFQGEDVPYFEIVKEVVYEHLKKVLPLLDLDKWLLIVDNTHSAPGPGVVYESDGTSKNERQYFFEVPDKELLSHHDNDMRSNDTSTAVGYSPASMTESIVMMVENTLNSESFKVHHPYVGTDIKVMARRIMKRLDITVCIPFISTHTPSYSFYSEKLQVLKEMLHELVIKEYPMFEVTISLNTRDRPDRSDYYLTLTGSSIESGDEGVVGRGNRYNGVIPFNRKMSMEACCGKNPVYHVGKVYTAICSIISKEIYSELGLESYVFLTSQMGRMLSDPWSACVEVTDEEISEKTKGKITAIVERNLSKTSEITQMIISGKLDLF